MTSSIFRLPENGLFYIHAIINRCEDLIHHGIWSGIHITRFRKWLANFNTDEEKYFAACLLDVFIYRSEEQTISLLKQLFQRVIPDLNRRDPMPIPFASNVEDALKKCLPPRDPMIRLVTVLQSSDPHSKSSPAIARLLKRKLSIDERWIIKASEIRACKSRGINAFLFVDDFLGTGHQFEDFIIAENLIPYMSDLYFAYIPITAHSRGIEHLQNSFKQLRVAWVEHLDESYCVFNQKCQCFTDGENDNNAAKKFYFDLLKRKRIDIDGPNRRGYGHLELAYAFSHAIPDNCLPIFWWSNQRDWHPLLDR